MDVVETGWTEQHGRGDVRTRRTKTTTLQGEGRGFESGLPLSFRHRLPLSDTVFHSIGADHGREGEAQQNGTKPPRTPRPQSPTAGPDGHDGDGRGGGATRKTGRGGARGGGRKGFGPELERLGWPPVTDYLPRPDGGLLVDVSEVVVINCSCPGGSQPLSARSCGGRLDPRGLPGPRRSPRGARPSAGSSRRP